jgi:hypothetical protein
MLTILLVLLLGELKNLGTPRGVLPGHVALSVLNSATYQISWYCILTGIFGSVATSIFAVHTGTPADIYAPTVAGAVGVGLYLIQLSMSQVFFFFNIEKERDTFPDEFKVPLYLAMAIPHYLFLFGVGPYMWSMYRVAQRRKAEGHLSKDATTKGRGDRSDDEYDARAASFLALAHISAGRRTHGLDSAATLTAAGGSGGFFRVAPRG